MTEQEFKLNDGLRKELTAALGCPAFREAVTVLLNRRRTYEASVEGSLTIDAIASVRLNSQRVGAEGLLADLHDMCEPLQPARVEEPPDFGEEEAARKLRILEDK